MDSEVGMWLTPSSQVASSGTFLALWGPELYTSCPCYLLDPALTDAQPQGGLEIATSFEWCEGPGMSASWFGRFLGLILTLVPALQAHAIRTFPTGGFEP